MKNNPLVSTIILAVVIFISLCNGSSVHQNKMLALSGRSATPPPTPSQFCTLRRAPKHICGVTGYARAPSVPLARAVAENLATCRDFCGHRLLRQPIGLLRSCEFFSFDTVSNICVLYDLDLEQGRHFKPDNSSTTSFYSQYCISCPLHCPDNRTENLVDNGGFELSKRHIGPWNPPERGIPATCHSIESPGYNSSNAYRYNVSSLSCIGMNLDQEFRLCHQDTYTLTVTLKYIYSNTSPNITDVFFGLGDLQTEIPFTHSRDWATFQYSFKTSAGYALAGYSQLHIFVLSKSLHRHGELTFGDSLISRDPAPPGVYLDNIQVHPAPASFITEGANLVQNSGFETGALAPWTLSCDPQCTTQAKRHAVSSPGLTNGSEFAFRLTTNPNNTQIITLSSAPFQTVRGTQYLLSMYYVSTNHSFDIAVVYPGHHAAATWARVDGTATQKPRHFQRMFTALGSNTRLDVTFYSRFERPGGASFLDDVQLLALA